MIGSVGGDSCPAEVICNISMILIKICHPIRGLDEQSADIRNVQAIPFLVSEAQKGALPLEKMVTYYKAADFATAFEDMLSGKTVKPVLLWDDIEEAEECASQID